MVDGVDYDCTEEGSHEKGVERSRRRMESLEL
jgi:hypothetical protein